MGAEGDRKVGTEQGSSIPLHPHGRQVCTTCKGRHGQAGHKEWEKAGQAGVCGWGPHPPSQARGHKCGSPPAAVGKALEGGGNALQQPGNVCVWGRWGITNPPSGRGWGRTRRRRREWGRRQHKRS